MRARGTGIHLGHLVDEAHHEVIEAQQLAGADTLARFVGHLVVTAACPSGQGLAPVRKTTAAEEALDDLRPGIERQRVHAAAVAVEAVLQRLDHLLHVVGDVYETKFVFVEYGSLEDLCPVGLAVIDVDVLRNSESFNCPVKTIGDRPGVRRLADSKPEPAASPNVNPRRNPGPDNRAVIPKYDDIKLMVISTDNFQRPEIAFVSQERHLICIRVILGFMVHSDHGSCVGIAFPIAHVRACAAVGPDAQAHCRASVEGVLVGPLLRVQRDIAGFEVLQRGSIPGACAPEIRAGFGQQYRIVLSPIEMPEQRCDSLL